MANPEIDNYHPEGRNPDFHGLKSPPLTYLATPYSYKCPNPTVKAAVQRLRFEVCSRAAGWLLSEKGWNVFSPITHSHPIHVLYPQVRGDWEFWKRIDEEFIQLSCRAVVLTLPGWRKSTGVTAELEIINRLNLELHFLHPVDDSFVMTATPRDDIQKFSADLV
jgi:hypothetical protein